MRRITSAPRRALSAHVRCLVFNPRIREYQFLLEEVFDMYTHYSNLGLKDTVNKELVDNILEECGKVSTTTLFPLYESGDASGGCKLLNGNVTTPTGYKEAYKAYIDGGWQGLSAPSEYGGQGLPNSLGFVQKEMMATANWPFFMYPGLSAGATTTLWKHGSKEQKDLYLTKLVSGEWSGTMCLTEPHCGTDLGQAKTRAVPNADGTYAISGTKIFISAGDHDMTQNIVHIVLAKLPDAAEGTKGLSLFIVPRHVVKADGTLTAEKNVKVVSIEKKMGIKANATAQLSFENSVGYIIGAPGEGLRQMFTFMNTARIGTAVQGVAHAELAFQNALRYARERYAMRALSGTKNPDKPGDAIIHHAGVKGHILFCKAVAEGGRAFVMDMARLTDLIDAAPSKAEAKTLDDELGVLTPIAKGLLTELGVESAYVAQQCYGGHGFINGNGMEQIARDARIATLYEGTTGVQALDLIGRKVLLSKKNYFGALQTKINATARPYMFSRTLLGQCARKLMAVNLRVKLSVGVVMLGAARDKEFVGSAALDFLMMTGYVVLGWYWLRMAIAAQKQIELGKDHDGFYKMKVEMCEFYFTRVLPRLGAHNEILTAPPKFLQINNDMLDQ